MTAIIQVIISGVIGPIIGPLFSWLNKKQDLNLDGFKTAAGVDLQAYKASLDAQAQANALKASANTWLGARIIAFGAGELSLFYYGAIVIDSMFHFGWGISKLPPPIDQYFWVILSSFVIVSPVAPVLSAASAWLTRKR
jgi:hypothetical protein